MAFKWLKLSGVSNELKDFSIRKNLIDLYYKVFKGSGVELSVAKLNKNLLKKYNVLGLIVDGKTVGFAFLVFHPKWIHLDYLGVHPSYQSFGFGKLILSKVKSLDKPIILECVDRLLGYYAKNNFYPLKIYNSYIYKGQKLNILSNHKIKYQHSSIYNILLLQSNIIIEHIGILKSLRFDINIIKTKPIFFKMCSDFYEGH